MGGKSPFNLACNLIKYPCRVHCVRITALVGRQNARMLPDYECWSNTHMHRDLHGLKQYIWVLPNDGALFEVVFEIFYIFAIGIK